MRTLVKKRVEVESSKLKGEARELNPETLSAQSEEKSGEGKADGVVGIEWGKESREA